MISLNQAQLDRINSHIARGILYCHICESGFPYDISAELSTYNSGNWPTHHNKPMNIETLEEFNVIVASGI